MQKSAAKIMMFAPFLVFFLHPFQSDAQIVHKCKTAGGGIVYQSDICGSSADLTIEEWNKSGGSPGEFSGQRITLRFQQKSLDAVLNIIAQVSGSDLYVDSSKDFVISAFYESQPWDRILHDLAKRYDLKITFSGAKMVVEQSSTGRMADRNPPELTEDDVIYDKLLASYEERFPQINPDSPKFDVSLVARIHAEMIEYAKRNPKGTQSDALSYAVLKTMGH